MYYIFDNGGSTADRYTLINKDGDIFGFSSNPFAPNGFGQFSHTVINKKGFIANALEVPEWLGKRVLLKDLSKEAQKFVNERR